MVKEELAEAEPLKYSLKREIIRMGVYAVHTCTSLALATLHMYVYTHLLHISAAMCIHILRFLFRDLLTVCPSSFICALTMSRGGQAHTQQ